MCFEPVKELSSCCHVNCLGPGVWLFRTIPPVVVHFFGFCSLENQFNGWEKDIPSRPLSDWCNLSFSPPCQGKPRDAPDILTSIMNAMKGAMNDAIKAAMNDWCDEAMNDAVNMLRRVLWIILMILTRSKMNLSSRKCSKYRKYILYFQWSKSQEEIFSQWSEKMSLKIKNTFFEFIVISFITNIFWF